MSGTMGVTGAGAGVGGGRTVRSVAKTSSSMHKESSAARVTSSPGCQSNSSALSSVREGN